MEKSPMPEGSDSLLSRIILFKENLHKARQHSIIEEDQAVLLLGQLAKLELEIQSGIEICTQYWNEYNYLLYVFDIQTNN
jgi:hypothetical protein